ncbi:MAG TPA: cyclase family protein [Gammaproteobacteria bacterium]|nr:cyclase family protein [Gammaproteobacteria bacterium]
MFSNTNVNVSSDSIESALSNQEMKYYDLTAPITTKTVVFPGDPQFKTKIVCSLKNGAPFNLCCMEYGNHTGTHMDYPAHTEEGGKTM